MAGRSAAFLLLTLLFSASTLLTCSDGEMGTAEFLVRVERALTAEDKVASVKGRAEAVSGPTPAPLWSTQGWYDPQSDRARLLIQKDLSARLDVAEQTLVLRIKDDVYLADPSGDERTRRLSRDDMPICYKGEPRSVVLILLCGHGLVSEAGQLRVEGVVDFEGRRLRSLALTGPDDSTARLLVEPHTFVPVAQTLSAQGTTVFVSRYQVEFVELSSVPPGLFDPRSIGYVPPEEAELAILDNPNLGVPVYWPGRVVSGTPGWDAILTRVEARGGPGADGPGHVLTLTYEGSGGRFRLDYWPLGKWEDFQKRLGAGFVWARCSERRPLAGGPGEIVVLRGHDPGMIPLPGVQTAGSTPVPLPPLFPNGCPSGLYDRFMAEVHFPDVVVTINAPYGVAAQVTGAFGVFESEGALENIARRLRLRQQGE